MNIFQKLGELTSSQRDYHDVATALESLRLSGKPVTVKFEGEKRSYSSRVTAFNRDHKIFVLADIFPPAPGQAFQKGRIASISSTDNQKTISLSGVCVEPLVASQSMGYELKVNSSLSVEKFEQDFDFGLHHSKTSSAATTERKVVGL
ncbi:MAG: hypothetical protein R3F41_02710 [Gammaproteobacteria bacterium]|nr:hypothetical protein [Pseudomonadales bacterium]MCP5345796.1 hypothetical protein [Pseudomonadales bacterium]